MPLTLANGTTVTVIQPTAAQVQVVQPDPAFLSVVAVPAGSSFSESAFEWIQSSAASTWTIPMPGNWPNRRPDVTLFDSSNKEVESDVEWLPVTKTIIVTFPSPTSGVALIT